MPIKYNLTKYDILYSKIKRISAAKKDRKAMVPEEIGTMFKAILVAAFSSGHSWRTYRALSGFQPAILHSSEIKKEYEEALATQWKSVTPFDINEVANSHIADSSFSQWLLINVANKDDEAAYKKAWKELKAEFNEDCDGVEVVQSKQ